MKKNTIKRKIPRILFLLLIFAAIGLQGRRMLKLAASANEEQETVVQTEKATAVFSDRCFHSKDQVSGIYGYAGEVPIIIEFNDEQRIQNIRLDKHYETASYIKQVERSGLLQSWNGLSIADAKQKKVDAVSGATYSSTAIINTLTASLELIQPSEEKSDVQHAWIFWVKNGLTILVLALALVSFFQAKKMKKYRLILLASSVIVLGFWNGFFLSFSQINVWLTYGLRFYGLQLLLFVVLLISVILPLITNKSFYCAYVCPFGAAQELIGKVSPKKIAIKPGAAQLLSRLRQAILLGLVIALITGLLTDISNIEFFSAFLLQSASTFALIFAGSMLLISAFIPRFCCRYICPLGYCFGLLQ